MPRPRMARGRTPDWRTPVTDTVIEPAEPAAAPVDEQAPTIDSEMGPSLVELAIEELMAHPLNLREDLDVESMVPTVRELGLIQYPVVAMVDGQWRIIAGHRRAAAAAEAGLATVHCVVRQDLATDVAALTTMLVENHDRKGLTTSEQAKGYQQLLDLGLSATAIAKRTGRKRRDVKDAVDAMGKEAGAAAVAAGLTIAQAIVINEFEGDPAAVEDLYEAAAESEGDFNHAAARLRKDREEDAQRAETAAQIKASGVTLIDHESAKWPRARELSRLVSADDERSSLNAENHAECPGHAAAPDDYDPGEVEYFCLDPEAHGHLDRWTSNTLDGHNKGAGKMTEDEKAERRTVVANNKAWDVAVEVRRQWVREFVARKRPPKGLNRWCIGEVMREPGYFGDGTDGLLADLLGVDAPLGTYGRDVGRIQAETVTEVRLPFILFGQIAADRESHMKAKDPLGRNCWRYNRKTEARYLLQLHHLGYTLADVERLCVTVAFPDAFTEPDEDTDNATDPDDDSPASDDEDQPVPAGDSEDGPDDAA